MSEHITNKHKTLNIFDTQQIHSNNNWHFYTAIPIEIRVKSLKSTLLAGRLKTHKEPSVRNVLLLQQINTDLEDNKMLHGIYLCLFLITCVLLFSFSISFWPTAAFYHSLNWNPGKHQLR